MLDQTLSFRMLKVIQKCVTTPSALIKTPPLVTQLLATETGQGVYIGYLRAGSDWSVGMNRQEDVLSNQ